MLRKSYARHMPGDWRASVKAGGTAHKAHLWRRGVRKNERPACDARIAKGVTRKVSQPMDVRRLCYDCLAMGASGRV